MISDHLFQIISGIQPLQNTTVLVTTQEKFEANFEAGNWAKYWIEDGFRKLEQKLEATAGRYCYKDSLSIADVCLVPQVYNAKK